MKVVKKIYYKIKESFIDNFLLEKFEKLVIWTIINVVLKYLTMKAIDVFSIEIKECKNVINDGETSFSAW